jgi:hypothetical protein
LRQRRHHRAFRIAPPLWDEPLREHLGRLLAEIVQLSQPERAAEPAEARQRQRVVEPSFVDEKALAEAATNLWRAQRRLDQPGEDSAARGRQAGRFLRTCREALVEAGLDVQEHDGDAFHPGRSLEVLAFQDDASLATETVLETVRPSIYFRGRRIQMGQVIVGCPAPRQQGPVQPRTDEE